jgi:hypothetical protein
MDLGRWLFPMVWFLKVNQILKFLGPSLGVKQMWIKRNDHAPKNECVDFFWYALKREVLKIINQV